MQFQVNEGNKKYLFLEYRKNKYNLSIIFIILF